jgi:hypothetical protein
MLSNAVGTEPEAEVVRPRLLLYVLLQTGIYIILIHYLFYCMHDSIFEQVFAFLSYRLVQL